MSDGVKLDREQRGRANAFLEDEDEDEYRERKEARRKTEDDDYEAGR